MRRGESGATTRKCRWNTRHSFVARQPRGDTVRMSIAIVREMSSRHAVLVMGEEQRVEETDESIG